MITHCTPKSSFLLFSPFSFDTLSFSSYQTYKQTNSGRNSNLMTLIFLSTREDTTLYSIEVIYFLALFIFISFFTAPVHETPIEIIAARFGVSSRDELTSNLAMKYLRLDSWYMNILIKTPPISPPSGAMQRCLNCHQ